MRASVAPGLARVLRAWSERHCSVAWLPKPCNWQNWRLPGTEWAFGPSPRTGASASEGFHVNDRAMLMSCLTVGSGSPSWLIAESSGSEVREGRLRSRLPPLVPNPDVGRAHVVLEPSGVLADSFSGLICT